jgi:hypothetical protein
MKPHLSPLMLILLIGLALIATTLPARAQTPDSCGHPPKPPLAAQAAALDPSPALAGTAGLNLPPLKAVLLVGPIDGDDGELTSKARADMELAAGELEANGVSVARFYTPNTDWGTVRAATNGAHFLIYRGHGVYMGDMPSPSVGGFYLGNDSFISPNQVRQELQLDPNAIIMLYGCFTAGSSGNDVGEIGSQEAQRRVAEYSDPFFDAGAGGYYANWFGEAFQMYVRTLFAGKTLGQAYEAYRDFSPASVERYSHPAHPDMAMWLDKDNWSGIKYNNAFVGRPDQTLESLFVTPAMKLSQTDLTVLIQSEAATTSRQVTVAGAGGASFNWSAAIATIAPTTAGWLQLSPLSGSSGQNLTVSVSPGQLPPGNYSATITIRSDTSQISDSEQTLTVQLFVRDQIFSTYLPSVRR